MVRDPALFARALSAATARITAPARAVAALADQITAPVRAARAACRVNPPSLHVPQEFLK